VGEFGHRKRPDYRKQHRPPSNRRDILQIACVRACFYPSTPIFQFVLGTTSGISPPPIDTVHQLVLKFAVHTPRVATGPPPHTHARAARFIPPFSYDYEKEPTHFFVGAAFLLATFRFFGAAFAVCAHHSHPGLGGGSCIGIPRREAISKT
jgi:hypothetical protein